MPHPSSATRPWLLLALASGLLCGCVERELVIDSEPAAEIFLDGEAVGRAEPGRPLRVPFDDYGTREVIARAKGHLPRREAIELSVPWYQVFPLGFFADVLWPGTIHDEHPLTLRLRVRPTPTDAAGVAARAEAFAPGGAPE